MPDDGQQVATVAGRDLAKMPLERAIDAYTINFRAVLPPHIAVGHFKRMVLTAVSTNPDLYNADRRTLFNACVKCASDGLLPDGREAALVVYRTKIKDREGKEHWIDAVQYMPMVAGIRKRMRNSGEVISAVAEVVFRNDHFRHIKGDAGSIEHEPAPLDKEPGDVVGAYAIIKLVNGEVIREVVRRSDIERARVMSRAKDGPAWKNWDDEMARKVALRRASKAAPASASMPITSQLLDRDEEEPDLPPAEQLPAIPPRPRREEFVEESRGVAASTAEFDAGSSPAGAANEDIPLYDVVNCDGETTPCTAETVEENIMAVFAEAQKRGRGAIEAAIENNQPAIDALGTTGIKHSHIWLRLDRESAILRAYLSRSAEDGLGEEEVVPESEQTASDEKTPDLRVRLTEHLKASAQLADIKLNKPGSDWEAYSVKLLEAIPLVSDPAQFAKCRLSHDMNRLRTAGEAQKERWQAINFAMAERERVLSKKERSGSDDHASTDSG